MSLPGEISDSTSWRLRSHRTAEAAEAIVVGGNELSNRGRTHEPMKGRTLSCLKFDWERSADAVQMFEFASPIKNYGKGVVGVKSDYAILNEPPYTRTVRTVV
jgi:hypothetical protein